MKKMLLTALCIVTVSAMATAMTDGEYNAKIDEIVWKKSPARGHSGINPDVVSPLVDDWIRTNAPATHGQELIAARWQMTLAAMNAEWEKFDKCFAMLRGETNNVARQDQFHQARNKFSNLREATPLAARKGAREGLKRFVADESGLFDDAARLQMIPVIVENGVKMFGSREESEWDEYIAKVKAMPDIKPWRRRAVGQMVNALFPLGSEMAKDEFAKNRSLIGEEEETSFLLALADSCVNANDRPGFDEILAKIKSFAAERKPKPYATMLEKLHNFDRKTARELLDAELSDKTLAPEARVPYVEAKLKFYAPLVFNYKFNEEGLYAKWTDAIRERLSLPGFEARFLGGWINTAIGFEDYDLAGEMIAKGLEKAPENLALLKARALVKANTGDMAGAIADYELMMKTKDFEKDRDSKGIERLVRHLKGEKPKSGETIAALRDLCRRLYALRRYDDCRALQAFWEKTMMIDPAKKAHGVIFDEDAPKSAEGFVRSRYFDDFAAMETRFENYCRDFHMRKEYDEKLLRTYDDKVDPAYRTGIKAIADSEGLHIFIRCDDPEIDDVKTGKRKNAGGLEIFFEPGDHEFPYHSIFFTDLPGTGDPHDSDWALPDRKFRRSKDCIFKDAVFTKCGMVAHIYMPWIGFYDALPFDGRYWTLGVYRYLPKGLICTGGAVHALGRGLKLEFQFTKSQKEMLKKRITLTAYNRYANQRNDDGDFILRWNDKLLGDTEFFDSELKPLLERLDKAGETLEQGETAKWAEIRYEISDRRKDYLRRKLLAE